MTFTESVYFIRNLPPTPQKNHQQINPLRLELKEDIGPEVVLHTIVLETVFDLNLKRRKAEEKGDDETEGGVRGAGGETAEEEKFCQSEVTEREKKEGIKA